MTAASVAGVVGLVVVAAALAVDGPAVGAARLRTSTGRGRTGWASLRNRWGGRFPLAVLGAVIVTAATFAFVPTLVAAAAGGVILRRWRAGRRASALERQRADEVNALLALAAELRSGLAPGAALQTVGTATPAGSLIGGRMLAAAASESLGGDPARMLMDAAEPGSATAALAAAWTVSRRTGARLAAPVGRIAAGAAADLRIRREANAALAGARSSAHLLAILPVAGIGLGAVSGTGSIRVLLTTPIGQVCLAAGVALDLAGLLWLDRLAAAGSA